jgi:hypothetical protein
VWDSIRLSWQTPGHPVREGESMNCKGKWLLLVLACSPLMAAGNPFVGIWKEPFVGIWKEPFVGIWKENIAKSLRSNRSEQSAVVSIESAGDSRVKIIQEFVNPAGTKRRVVDEYPLNGTEIHPLGEDPNFTRSFRSINPNVWQRIVKDRGEIRDECRAVSGDGKILIITGFGKNSSGKAYYFHRVFERQNVETGRR